MAPPRSPTAASAAVQGNQGRPPVPCLPPATAARGARARPARAPIWAPKPEPRRPCASSSKSGEDPPIRILVTCLATLPAQPRRSSHLVRDEWPPPCSSPPPSGSPSSSPLMIHLALRKPRRRMGSPPPSCRSAGTSIAAPALVPAVPMPDPLSRRLDPPPRVHPRRLPAHPAAGASPHHRSSSFLPARACACEHMHVSRAWASAHRSR